MMERTLVLLKPDAVERRLVGRIINIYEQKGLHIAALKMVKPAKEIVEIHYQIFIIGLR
jgi:nucleoside-diphosphate kinase